MFAVDIAISQNQYGVTAFDGIYCPGTECCEASLDAVRAPSSRVANIEFKTSEFVASQFGDAANSCHFFVIQHGLIDFEAQWRIDVVDIEQVGLGADEGHQGHDHLFADRIDRRIGHLCKKLTEIVVEGFCPARQHRKRCIVTHRTDRFFTCFSHHIQHKLEVFLRPAKGLLTIKQASGDSREARAGGGGQRLKLDA